MINWQQGELYIEKCSATELAMRFATPLYVYSGALLASRCASYAGITAPFEISSRYAVKANPNLTLLSRIANAGLGFDVVSGGELARCLKIGADPAKIVYSGVGKTKAELQFAMQSSIAAINIESDGECERIIELAAACSKSVNLAIRVNPNIAVDTHPYIATALDTSKFGVALSQLANMAKKIAAAPNCRLVGIGCHLGSMLEDYQPLVDACAQLRDLAQTCARYGDIQHISIGGGLAVRYRDEHQPQPQQMINACIPLLAGSGLSLMLEPGRSIVAECGITLTRVEYCKYAKQRNFAIVDAAMNDLPRPSLYNAWHDIKPVVQSNQGESQLFDVVGPICEMGDFIGLKRELAIAPNDLLAVMTTGAYTASMASNYNARPRAASVLVDGDQAELIARRETLEDMYRIETELNQVQHKP